MRLPRIRNTVRCGSRGWLHDKRAASISRERTTKRQLRWQRQRTGKTSVGANATGSGLAIHAYQAGEGRKSMIAGSLANTERDLRKVISSAAAAAIVMLGTLSEASALIRISYADKKIRITYTNSTAPVPKRLGFNAASATVLITDDRGGKIGDYLNAFASVRDSGHRAIINGPCYSACTLILGVVPRDRICATSSAQLGFHAAAKKDLFGRQVSSPEGTQLVWDTYPVDVRRWITHRGGLSAQMIFLKGRELESMVRPCHSPMSR
jgi:hypothetical protein